MRAYTFSRLKGIVLKDASPRVDDAALTEKSARELLSRVDEIAENDRQVGLAEVRPPKRIKIDNTLVQIVADNAEVRRQC